MADQPKHICAGISYDNVRSDLCYELNSGETTPKDVREYLHAALDEYLDQGVERQRTGLFYVGRLPIDDADDTKSAFKEAKEQIWKSKCVDEVEKNVDLKFTIEGLEKELNELEQSVSGWKRRYEELDLQHQDTLMDLFDATNGETPSPMASRQNA